MVWTELSLVEWIKRQELVLLLKEFMGCWRRIIGRCVPRREGWVLVLVLSLLFPSYFSLNHPIIWLCEFCHLFGDEFYNPYHSSLFALLSLAHPLCHNVYIIFVFTLHQSIAYNPDRPGRIRNQSQSRRNPNWINPLGFKSSENVDWWYPLVSPLSLPPLFFLWISFVYLPLILRTYFGLS